MNSILISGTGLIGSALRPKLEAVGHCIATSRSGPVAFELTGPITMPEQEVVYLVACIATFRGCELERNAYAVNVDAPIRIAAHYKNSFIVFMSSEAAEWSQSPLGMQKRAAELGLLAICGYRRLAIVRAGKILASSVDALCDTLVSIGRLRQFGTHQYMSQHKVFA